MIQDVTTMYLIIQAASFRRGEYNNMAHNPGKSVLGSSTGKDGFLYIEN
jgi:hypothetical protein